MKQRIAMGLRMGLVCGGQVVIGWSQTPVSAVPAAFAAPVVEVIALPTGAAVQAAGAGFGALGLGHVSWASQKSQSGVTQVKDESSFSITTRVGLRLDCPRADAGRRASIAAVLDQLEARYVVSIDQITLSTAPVIISPIASCGSTTLHTFSVKVPVSASAGPIAANVRFQVTLQ